MSLFKAKAIIVLLSLYTCQNVPFFPALNPVIFCSTVECLTCVCSLGKRVKLFPLEWRSRKRRLLLCLMTIFDFPHSNLFWLHAGAVVMANRSVDRILRKGQKFPWEVKIPNNSRNEHLSPFLSHRAAGVYPMLTGRTVTYSFLRLLLAFQVLDFRWRKQNWYNVRDQRAKNWPHS